jgi:hypothetical protein
MLAVGCVVAVCAEYGWAQQIIWIPRSSSGPSPIIPSSGYARARAYTAERDAAWDINYKEFSTFRSSVGDFTMHVPVGNCIGVTRNGPETFELTTVCGRKMTTTAPGGSLESGSGDNKVMVAWKDVTKVLFDNEKRSSSAEPAITVTAKGGESVTCSGYGTPRPLRWHGMYDRGYNWTWFVPIIYSGNCRARIDICQVETITQVAQAQAATDTVDADVAPKFQFLLADGRTLTAELVAGNNSLICDLGDGWASIGLGQIAKIQVHLDNIRPPAEHIAAPEYIKSRKGGPPYARVVLRNGQTVSFEAARWVNVGDNDSLGAVTKASLLCEGQDTAQDLDVGTIVAVQWRGARPDVVRLADGTELKGRIDVVAENSAAVFGKLDEYVWGFVPVTEIRTLALTTEKDVTRPGSPASE